MTNHAKSMLPQNEIDDPASANVRPRPAQVIEDGGIVATGFFEGVGKDGEAGGVQFAGGQGTLFVGGGGEVSHGWGSASSVDRCGSEGIEDVP